MHTSDHSLENTETGNSDVRSVKPLASVSMHTSNDDLEIAGTGDVESVKVSTSISESTLPNPEPETFDIEHAPVHDDPRKWSPLRKNITLALIASASLLAGINTTIQSPAVQQIETQLSATPSQFSLSVGLFMLVQGLMPLFWSAISEVKGRKLVYFFSLFLFTLGTIIVALSHSIGLVTGFRCMQAAGSSSVISIGAATLADIFDPAVRGQKMGIYYMAPLLGPSIGSIFGGVLTSAFNWRAAFWFLAIISGLSFLSFIFFFRDTFRRERSLTYQNVIKQRRKAAALSCSNGNQSTHNDGSVILVEKNTSDTEPHKETSPAVNLDLSLTDVNHLKPLVQVLRRPNNVLVLIPSGLLFGFTYIISYACARTLSTSYGYSPIKIGFVNLAFGIGSIFGSVLGGRWSDYELRRLKKANGGKSRPEMRLRSTFLGTWGLPPCVLCLGWIFAKHVHISAICIFLFLCGFFLIWSYSSTLAYLVDANNGRSSTATAMNCTIRGILAFVATEIVVPLQDSVGDGWFYTIWAGLLLLSGLLTLVVWRKGSQWREAAEAREAEYAKRFDLPPISDAVPTHVGVCC